MRIVLIILSLAAVLLVVWLGANAMDKNPLTNTNASLEINGTTLPTTTTTHTSNSVDSLTIDLVKTNARLEAQIDELNKKVDQLSGMAGTQTITTTTQPVQNNSSTTASGATQTGEIIPISAKFLTKVLPTIEPVKTDNSGVFDLRIFDQTPYNTYKDEKFGITIVASMLPYSTFLKNFQAVDKTVYTVNETKTFPFESFYVNPAKPDAMVRIVMKVEAQTLLISLPKSKFNTLKELILKTN